MMPCACCDRSSKNTIIIYSTKSTIFMEWLLVSTLRPFFYVLTSDKRSSANKYQCAWHALITLGLPQIDTRWQELHDDELCGKNVSTTCTMGDSQKCDPWFWHVIQPANLSTKQQEEWSIDSASSFTTPYNHCLYIFSGLSEVVLRSRQSRSLSRRGPDA